MKRMTKLGIVIVFDFFDKSIYRNDFIHNLQHAEEITFCLVSNNSNEELYESLSEIAELCDHVSVVNVKKRKTKQAAIRSGVRYLTSHFNLKYLGYIQNSAQLDILETLKKFNKYKERMKKELNLKSTTRISRKPNIKDVFSVESFLVKYSSEFGSLANS